jgi:lysozyme family protein
MIPKNAYSAILNTIENHEGPFQKMEADRGNYCNNVLSGTKYGISARTLGGLGYPCNERFIRDITKDWAVNWYYKHFWKPYKISEFPVFLQPHIFDIIVNGAGNAAKVLNNAFPNQNFTQNWSENAQKIHKLLTQLGAKQLNNQIVEGRKAFFKSVYQPEFIKGWLDRAEDWYIDSDIAASAKNSLPLLILLGGAFYFLVFRDKK